MNGPTRDEIQERERRALAARIAVAGVAPRYQTANFDSFKAGTDHQADALRACKDFATGFTDMLKDGSCLTLVGGVGTGKTLLASAIVNHVLERVWVEREVYASGSWKTERQRATAKYTTVMRMLRDIRDTYRKDSPLTEKTVLRAHIQPDLLVLDEVGVQRGTEDERIQLFEVLDSRYGELRPTVLVSNLDVEGLKTYIGERVFDRLKEGAGGAVIFDWQSHRGTA